MVYVFSRTLVIAELFFFLFFFCVCVCDYDRPPELAFSFNYLGELACKIFSRIVHYKKQN